METVLPGVFIDVRPEGLIVPGRVTVGNIGIVGTANKGPVGEPVVLGSLTQAREQFGQSDPWINGDSNELTLIRALEIAYAHGATTVVAVRTATDSAAAASCSLASASGESITLSAKTPGTAGNNLAINVTAAEQDAFVEEESVDPTAPTFSRIPVVKGARNRILVNGLSRQLIYDDAADPVASGQIQVDRATGSLTFPAGETPVEGDTISAFYTVAQTSAVKVTLRYGQAEEIYTVVDNSDLERDINANSLLVDAELIANDGEVPTLSTSADVFAPFQGGVNGADAGDAEYQTSLELLLDEEVQIVLGAGRDESFGNELDAHCQIASSDAVRRDRIGVVGTGTLSANKSASVGEITEHTQASDRIILVAPGITVNDTAASTEVTLPGAYAAAAIAGLLSSYSPHISLTNKTLRVGGLEHRYNNAELAQIVRSRVLALESRQGFRVVRGITTATNTAWTQITTRRIVDYAKYGVRSAANPYIGLLNNERVRGALRATINSFLAGMVTGEMLVSYELDVSATREQERQGIVQVIMTLRPTFSIDFIQVTMFLE